MGNSTEYFVQQLEEVSSEFREIKDELQSQYMIEELQKVKTKAIAAVVRIVGKESDYYSGIDAILKKKHINEYQVMRRIIGCTEALREDLENGYLKSLSEIVHSEVFSDYIGMSEHLLEGGYKDAAAVIVGSSLESHIRELCRKSSIPIETNTKGGKKSPKNADAMNNELYVNKIYNKSWMSQVSAWQKIRNDAAHGNYGEYNDEQVKLMISGIRNFVSMHPA